MTVATYTVRVEKGGSDGGPWETIVDNETVSDERSPQDLADEIAHLQTVADNRVWRVQVWTDHEVWQRKPEAEVYRRHKGGPGLGRPSHG